MKLPLATLLILLTASTVWSAPSRTTPAGRGATINLGRSVGSRAVGVEPQGGRFARVIEPEAVDGTHKFSTYTGNQPTSVLAIYVTNKSLIPFEKPAARVVISGLPRGETQPRIQVTMTLSQDCRAVTVTARDIGRHGGKLNVDLLPVGEALNAQLQMPAKPGSTKLKPIALGNEPTGAKSRRWIGIRSAGGMFEPVLYPGETRSSRPTYFTTRYPGQPTADLKLFAGNNPYIENSKLHARYIISGFTPKGRLQKGIKLDFEVDHDGDVIPIATEMKTGATLQVTKYSDAAAKSLAQPWPQRTLPEEKIAGRIPATPTL